MSQIRTLDARAFFTLGTGRVTETLDYKPTNSSLRNLLAINRPTGGKHAKRPFAPHMFTHIDVLIFDEFRSKMDVRALEPVSLAPPKLAFASSERHYENHRAAGMDVLNKLGWWAQLADCALFVNQFCPVVTGGPGIDIYFIGSLGTKGKNEKYFYAPCLSINTKGCFLRYQYLAGFAKNTWFAVNPDKNAV